MCEERATNFSVEIILLICHTVRKETEIEGGQSSHPKSI